MSSDHPGNDDMESMVWRGWPGRDNLAGQTIISLDFAFVIII